MALAELDRDLATGVVTLTVNRPEVLNAIDVPTAQAISAAVLTLQGDTTVRCIVLRGAGRAFVAGGDLARFAEDFEQAGTVVNELLDALHPAIEILTTHDAPVLASVHGAVAGAGLSLMLACDLVVAAEGTRFLSAYDRIGASPDCGATWLLPRVLGPRKAMELYLLGETWSSEQAERYGLINRVVAADQLQTETEKLARRLASGPTRAYAAYKRLARESANATLPEHLEQERAAFIAATKTADFRIGVTAFLNKQPATFQGN